MALARDLSDLPAADKRSDGEPPDTRPRFAQLLVEAWARRNTEAGPKPTAHGTRIRHSDAGKCARAVSYRAAGIPESDPMDLPGVWVTSLGTMLHEHWQAALAEVYPDALIEPKLRIDGLDASGHADAVIRTGGTTILYELKSVGGFSYKMKVGERGAPEGPSLEHKAQAALNGLAVDADEIIIGYVATEAISRAAAARKHIDELGRFVAEWTYTRDEFEPWAKAEQTRLQAILDLIDNGQLAARKFPTPELPARAEIVDPEKGRWEVRGEKGIEDTGTFWACLYCSYQTVCTGTEAGRIPIDSVVPMAVGA